MGKNRIVCFSLSWIGFKEGEKIVGYVYTCNVKHVCMLCKYL